MRKLRVLVLLFLAVAALGDVGAQSAGGRGQGRQGDITINLPTDQGQLLLRFQLIEAWSGESRSAFATQALRDPAIADVDTVLRDLFRFTYYRLVSQAAVMLGAPPGVGGSNSFQILSGPGGAAYELAVGLYEARNAAATYTLQVTLSESDSNSAGVTARQLALGDRSGRGRVLLQTTVTVRAGRTVVLGSTQPGGSQAAQPSALILVVRPQLEKQ